MEVYYQRKLLNVSNNRIENSVADKFLGKVPVQFSKV